MMTFNNDKRWIKSLMPSDIRPNHQALVYVSYAWGDDTPEGMEREKIVDQLCEVLYSHDRINVGRDKRRLEIGDSIEAFAADIARADLVLAVVSSKYLRSYHCMVEEMYKVYLRTGYCWPEFQKKVCLLLLDDGKADIDLSQALIDHWCEFERQYRSKLEQLDPHKKGSPHEWDVVNTIYDMCERLPQMLSALRDIIMPRGCAEISRDGFDALRQLIRKRLQEWWQWRADSRGIAAEIRDVTLDSPAPEPQGLSGSCLALILQRGEELEDDPQWAQREFPWEVRSYTWEAKLHHSASDAYRDQSLQADIGTYLIASTDAAPPAAVGTVRSTFADLVQAAVDWMDGQSVATPITLELFVPTELLGFDWAGIQLRGRTDYDQSEELFKRHPFILRSADRFHSPDLAAARRSRFPTKFQLLLSGQGRWIADPSAGQVDKLRESEEHDHLVALKRFEPLDASPLARLIWQRRVVEAMVPLAIWWRSPQAKLEKIRQTHLDEAYEGLLSGHNDGDLVPWKGCQLEKLPRLRRGRITDPLTRDLVLLLDRPDRHPWPEAFPSRSL